MRSEDRRRQLNAVLHDWEYALNISLLGVISDIDLETMSEAEFAEFVRLLITEGIGRRAPDPDERPDDQRAWPGVPATPITSSLPADLDPHEEYPRRG